MPNFIRICLLRELVKEIYKYKNIDYSKILVIKRELSNINFTAFFKTICVRIIIYAQSKSQLILYFFVKFNFNNLISQLSR